MKTSIQTQHVAFLFLLACLISCGSHREEARDTLDLSGEWSYSPDLNNEGLEGGWSAGNYQRTTELPGIPEKAVSGPVWFSRKVNIPETWKGKSIQLVIERTKHVMVWVDGQPSGKSDRMFAPQYHDLSALLTPGEHTLTFRVDSSRFEGFDPVLGSANTLMGGIKLEAASFTHLTEMYITPNVETKKLRIKLHLANPPKQENLIVKISLQYVLGNLNVNAATTTYRVKSDSTVSVNYVIRGRMPLWDEFKQPLIRLTAQVFDNNKVWVDALSSVYGLTSFGVRGSQYVVNDQCTFLRGYIESGQFLLASPAAMDEETWTKRFEAVKQEGFNQCRFISWCPPDAAFCAADKIGIYLQVDMPALTPSVKAILSAYGHHPSFVLFSSNTSDWKRLSSYGRSLTAPITPLFIKSYPSYSVKQSATAYEKELAEASAKLASLCYRADMEAALRTPGLSGYQLMEFPSLIQQNPAGWRSFNNSVVPLVVFDKSCWSQSESFAAGVEVANYSNKTLTSTVKWTVNLPDGKTVKSGTVSSRPMEAGKVSNLGAIRFSLAEFNKPVKLDLTVKLDSTDYSTVYPIWVYPASTPGASKSVIVSSVLNKAVMNQLEAGGKVVLIPTIRSIYSNSLPGSFAPGQPASGVSAGTLGLLIQSKHPIFSDFPTESNADWQWLNIVTISRALNLSQLDAAYRPIVQVIDHPKRNLKLGMICEFKVGAGRLLICTSKLFEIMDKPEAVQLYNSLLRYAESEAFKPTYALSPEMLKRLVSYTVTTMN